MIRGVLSVQENITDQFELILSEKRVKNDLFSKMVKVFYPMDRT
uniref:Uncharacterized protein n=1 Tax=viral metagenome TaxID=1070528 RepID=A0A6M3IZT8_9ZZZZ